MLGLAELTNDLYFDPDNPQGYIGYYKELKRINTSRDSLIKEQSGLLSDISEYQASLQAYTLTLNEAEEQYRDKIILFKTKSGYTFEQLISDKTNSWWDNEDIIILATSIGQLKSIINTYSSLTSKIKENLDSAQRRYDQIERILSSKEESQDGEERLLLEKIRLHETFYKKYSRFLQEGSWISEDYIDDNLYFLDAQSTLLASSKPRISYDISVLELSQLEDYKSYVFNLGDLTYIEDTEFFGWVWGDNGTRSPYKEEIIVTETVIMLDQPEQNQIKVQNYKTQFEDLFQRIAATTQAIEYSTGKYQKVSNIIESDGTINITTLQNSIANNALILQNAKDQSVIWNETGITTFNMSNPSEIVRIVSGGIFLSIDGGITWNTGITGKGINANHITSGQINTESISILNGSFPSFRWDSTGINAYSFSLNQTTGEADYFDFGRFVRLDQYGLYGINNLPNFNPAAPSETRDGREVIGEDKIWEFSNFALTWRGFHLRSSHDSGGYISITSNQDFQVINGYGREQVKIGLLSIENETPYYGIRLRDSNGNTVMEHMSNGKLWIRDELQIGNGSSRVSLGYLSKFKKDAPDIHEVINAADDFIVYEDGTMIAKNGEFTGTIYATGGKIGNLEISTLSNLTYEVAIEVENGAGTIFEKGEESKILVAYLYKNGEKINQDSVSYQWLKDEQILIGQTQQTLEIKAEDIPKVASYTCQITMDD